MQVTIPCNCDYAFCENKTLIVNSPEKSLVEIQLENETSGDSIYLNRESLEKLVDTLVSIVLQMQ